LEIGREVGAGIKVGLVEWIAAQPSGVMAVDVIEWSGKHRQEIGVWLRCMMYLGVLRKVSDGRHARYCVPAAAGEVAERLALHSVNKRKMRRSKKRGPRKPPSERVQRDLSMTDDRVVRVVPADAEDAPETTGVPSVFHLAHKL
jgi:hypothetical protein